WSAGPTCWFAPFASPHVLKRSTRQRATAWSDPPSKRGPISATDEDRRALLNVRLGCFPVVLGAAALHLVGGFHIEKLGQTAALGAVQVALHQAERDRRPMRQRAGQFHCDSGEIFIGKDAFDETERQRF